MNSISCHNDNFFFNHEDYQRRSIFNSHRNKVLTKIWNEDILKQNSFKKINIKENSMRNFKKINFSKIQEIREITKNKNRKVINLKFMLPLLDNKCKPKREQIFNNNSLILNNIQRINQFNQPNDLKSKYLYLEYTNENNEDSSDNETNFIEISPNKIISFLYEYSNLKKIFKILTEKINKRNINSNNINNSDSRININDILNNSDNRRKNKGINYINNVINISSNIFLLGVQYKANCSIQDLFLLDIINKVINKAIFFRDKKIGKINEEFMFAEYKNQIKNLKLFFDEKINSKKINESFKLIKEQSKIINTQRNINLKETLFNNDNMNDNIIKSVYKKDMNMDIFHKINNQKQLKKLSEPSERINNDNIYNNNIKSVINRPKLNIYNFNIGPKINIIDFDELLNKINKKRLEAKDKNSNISGNILKKLLELNKKKIKFGNRMIEEKTKILTNKNSSIFNNENSKYNSRNIFFTRKFNKKNLILKHELLNLKDKDLNSSKKETVLNTKSDDSLSLINDNNYLKIISLNEKTNNLKEKMNIEKLGIKKDFGITKVGFNKTIDRIRIMNNNNKYEIRKKMKKFNFSFLNSIYGKINNKRKLKINEIDYKEEIKQKGYELLNDSIFHKNSKMGMKKNLSAENIFMANNKEKENKILYKTLDKATSTKDIKFIFKEKEFF